MRMPVPKQGGDATYGKKSCSCFSAAVTPTLLTASLLQLIHRAGVVQSFSPAATSLTGSTEHKEAEKPSPSAGPDHLHALLSQARWVSYFGTHVRRAHLMTAGPGLSASQRAEKAVHTHKCCIKTEKNMVKNHQQKIFSDNLKFTNNLEINRVSK